MPFVAKSTVFYHKKSASQRISMDLLVALSRCLALVQLRRGSSFCESIPYSDKSRCHDVCQIHVDFTTCLHSIFTSCIPEHEVGRSICHDRFVFSCNEITKSGRVRPTTTRDNNVDNERAKLQKLPFAFYKDAK